MTTVLSNFSSIKKIGKNLTRLNSDKSCFFSEKTIEKLFSSQNLTEIESSLKPNELLELKKSIIIYKIKKIRNESALKIQKMWNKYIKKLTVHKLAHHLTGCYTVSIPAKGMTRAFIKIFNDEKNKDNYEIAPLRYCQIRNCFAYDVHKNKFCKSKKIMHFIFLNRNNEVFYDENYKKVLYFNEYVHEIDFSYIDENEKKLSELSKNEKKYSRKDSISTEDEKEISENSTTLSPSPKRSQKFKFDSNEEDDEYSNLRSKDSINIASGFVRRKKRFETFDKTYSCKTKLKSILMNANSNFGKKRKSVQETNKRVSFGKTETLCFK
jgi:hypothetical protein